MQLYLCSMNTITITTPQNIELEYDLASLGERIAAYLIDGLILGAYIVTVVTIFLTGNFSSRTEWVALLFLIPLFFYDLVSEVYMNGQSVGKKAMHIRVVSLDGAQATLGQYLIRWLFRLVDFTLSNALCAVICVAVSQRNQRLGDIVAGTTLIKTHPRGELQHTMYAPPPGTGEEYLVTIPEVVNLSDRDMQLIREVINSVNRSGNYAIAQQAADKIKATLQIDNTLEPKRFLEVVLADYNFLTSN